jgi:hypothetical protein
MFNEVIPVYLGFGFGLALNSYWDGVWIRMYPVEAKIATMQENETKSHVTIVYRSVPVL